MHATAAILLLRDSCVPEIYERLALEEVLALCFINHMIAMLYGVVH